jgi:hypothetical protein
VALGFPTWQLPEYEFEAMRTEALEDLLVADPDVSITG